MRWRSSLQASVESAESEWRVKLDASIKGLADARGQATSLAEKAAALEQEVAQSAQAGEMQGQLAALQAQLLGQEAEKKSRSCRKVDLQNWPESACTMHTSIELTLHHS